MQVDRGEQCDPGSGYIAGCSNACKLQPVTQCLVGDTNCSISTTPGSYSLPFTTIIPAGGSSPKEYNLGRGQIINYVNGKKAVFDPYKMDVYSLGLTILMMCSLGNFDLAERK